MDMKTQKSGYVTSIELAFNPLTNPGWVFEFLNFACTRNGGSDEEEFHPMGNIHSWARTIRSVTCILV